jgi:transposase-like protein
MIMTQQELEILFTDEVEAKKYWMKKRIEAGKYCNACQSKKLRWDSSHNSWVCRECNKSFAIRSGTVMQDSSLPIRVWFKAMYLMTLTKKGISALELQRQLGLKRYEPVLYMVQKLRAAMGERDSKYELSGDVELDDTFVRVVTPGRKKKPRVFEVEVVKQSSL